ncbi:hydroxypyruvate isomerase family protein [Marinimicrobium sp. ABcell2]|uniref:hydroxypyruvate isomerase family protein n=1 Tax=Marinimicrobium sp. ABcell2 TaxID=3069751 RepID=UPI0027B1B67E|nr:TIM barrel protein [Marinimicrobium sp. ABcell2]MDQ2076859.1 TIM barrel protein [Marinimicrobium sp. ABcell2]
MSHSLDRRTLLRNLVASTVGITALGTTGLTAMAAEQGSNPLQLKGNINHAVCRWPFHMLSLEELCEVVKSLGFSAIDLVGPNEWHILKEEGVDCSMCNGAEISLEEGWADTKYHPELIERYRKHIDLVAGAGYRNLICFSGNARGMDEETGLKNAVAGLKQIMGQAEKRGVVIQMELFNSKVDHPDYMCDNSPWGIELCKRLGSPNFKLLYDIYHMQISEGDIIRTITDHHEYFGHYHTAGVPGRNEIDDTQELYYPAIARAIKNTGFDGYVAQEFIPTRDSIEGKIQSLKTAIQICDV